MTPGPRDHKSATLRVSLAEALPEEMREATRELVALESTNPRKGHATTLLWDVCHEADRERITLILNPKPFGADGMDAEKLERFYGRFGFHVIQREPVVLMARSPDLIRRVARLQ